MTTIKPKKQIKTVWQISFSILAFVPAIAIFLFLDGNILKIALAVWVMLFLGVFTAYIPVYYRNLLYTIDNEKTVIKHGVFYLSHYTITNKHIQFTNIRRTPILRLFGLVTLVIIAPGAKLVLAGITKEEARHLVHLLGDDEI